MASDAKATPTCVVMYSLLAGPPGESTPIAEFRYDPPRGVTLTQLDPGWSRAARRIYDQGIRSRQHNRTITHSEGPAFMAALLEPVHSTYYGFIDKSHTTTGDTTTGDTTTDTSGGTGAGAPRDQDESDA